MVYRDHVVKLLAGSVHAGFLIHVLTIRPRAAAPAGLPCGLKRAPQSFLPQGKVRKGQLADFAVIAILVLRGELALLWQILSCREFSLEGMLESYTQRKNVTINLTH
jgi:hypothetical protein